MTATATPDLLAAIVAATRRIVTVREQAHPRGQLEKEVRRTPRGAAFDAALTTTPAPRVIAECKRRSPSKGVLRQAYHPAGHARAYAEDGAVAISVVTEPTFFDGDLEHLRAVRAVVDLPILRKDFIISEYQLVEAAAAGADAVLFIVGALDDAGLRRLLHEARDMSLAPLVEVHDLAELQRAVDAGASIIGVNSRNLRTLAVNLTVLDAVGAAIGGGITAVAESGIRTADDLARLNAAGYDAFLVGEQLMTHPDPGAALRELRNG